MDGARAWVPRLSLGIFGHWALRMFDLSKVDLISTLRHDGWGRIGRTNPNDQCRGVSTCQTCAGKDTYCFPWDTKVVSDESRKDFRPPSSWVPWHNFHHFSRSGCWLLAALLDVFFSLDPNLLFMAILGPQLGLTKCKFVALTFPAVNMAAVRFSQNFWAFIFICIW